MRIILIASLLFSSASSQLCGGTNAKADEAYGEYLSGESQPIAVINYDADVKISHEERLQPDRVY